MSGKGTPLPPVARDRRELAGLLEDLRAEGRRLAFVPTMGFLHEGHLRLMDLAREGADHVLISIFVNPLQFGPDEDLDRYPRDPERDLRLAGERGVAGVFAPEAEVMYPGEEPVVTVSPGPMGERLCGHFRPGHFRGVLTVVAKLFGMIRPDVAVFGRKDYQQAVLVQRMVEDLALGVEVRVGPLVREEDGLALSSRNAYLTPEERQEALGLSRALFTGEKAFLGGERELDRLLSGVREVASEHPGLRLQYVQVVEPDDLRPADELKGGQVLAAAGWVGDTRLIDNVVLGAGEPDPRVEAAWP